DAPASPLTRPLGARAPCPQLRRRPPAEPEALLMLAEATKSAELYERALEVAPGLLGAWRGLALLRFPDLQVMRKGLAARRSDPFLLTLYGEALRREGLLPEAEKAPRAANAEDGAPAGHYAG